jgi:hypothetical protein
MTEQGHNFATNADGSVSLEAMGPVMIKRIALHMARACGAEAALAALTNAKADVLAMVEVAEG